MREQQRPVFVAFDDAEFPTAAACREYERGKAPERLVGLTPEQVQAALDRTDPELAEAIETIGDKIKVARLAAGDRKRKRAGESETQEPVAQTAEPQQPSGEEEPEIPEHMRRTAQEGAANV